jgi:hypothetical protein
MATEETVRLFFGLFRLGREVKRDKLMIRKQPQQRGGLAGLASARQHHHGPGARRALQPGFDVSSYPHERNMRSNRIYCKAILWRSMLEQKGIIRRKKMCILQCGLVVLRSRSSIYVSIAYVGYYDYNTAHIVGR